MKNRKKVQPDMVTQRVGIAVECICDLPEDYLKEHGAGIIYFVVKTDRGEFLDNAEITAENIIAYMESGNRAPISSPPPAETFKELFGEMLEKYEEVVFVATGRKTSKSYDVAAEAVTRMGDKGKAVHVFDSKHLSTGLGHIVIKAVEMAESGCFAEEILSALTVFREKVSTTFIAPDADYLYRNGRVGIAVKRLCGIFRIHPVLVMRDGALKLKTVLFGNYERAKIKYVRRVLRRAARIDRSRIFVTQVGLNTRMIEKITAEIKAKCSVDELVVTNASATVSSNCGPGTFGVLFVNE